MAQRIENHRQTNDGQYHVRAVRGGHHGDVNGDGQVDLMDGLVALRVLAGTAPADAVIVAADVDGDARIGLAEAVYVLQRVARLR